MYIVYDGVQYGDNDCMCFALVAIRHECCNFNLSVIIYGFRNNEATEKPDLFIDRSSC